ARALAVRERHDEVDVRYLEQHEGRGARVEEFSHEGTGYGVQGAKYLSRIAYTVYAALKLYPVPRTLYPRMSFAAALRRLRSLGDPDDARFLQRFFKTAPGEYGAGDKFLGIRVPQTRKVAREFRGLPMRDIEALLREPWHEARLLAVILLGDAYA